MTISSINSCIKEIENRINPRYGFPLKIDFNSYKKEVNRIKEQIKNPEILYNKEELKKIQNQAENILKSLEYFFNLGL